MKNPKSTLSLVALAAGLVLNGVAQAPAAAAPAATPDAGTVRSAIDLIRSDIKTEKAYIIAQNVAFTDDEAAEFWPLYNEYNAALNVLLDERLVLTKNYLDQHETLTNEQATALADKVFAWEAKRLELKRSWFKKFVEVVPATKAAKFYQVENQLNAALDLKLMDSMPLIK
jgi:hypothetical protein